MRISAAVALAALLPAGAAWAGDSGFSNLEHQIESAYHIKKTHIPLLGVGRMATKTASPFGVSAFNLAVFEDVPEQAGRAAIHTPGPEWSKVVESASEGERTLIFARPEGKSIDVIVLAEEPGEITLIESRVNAHEFLKHLGGGPDD